MFAKSKRQLHVVDKSLFIDSGNPFSLAMIKACKQHTSVVYYFLNATCLLPFVCQTLQKRGIIFFGDQKRK